ncbi:MAG: SCP2 sterol-binding domain-containing protein, partial [Candidatus Binatia bacterium]
LTMTYSDAASLQKGDLDPMGAFMQGKMSVSGKRLKMMKLMPLTNAPEWKALQEDVKEVTAY